MDDASTKYLTVRETADRLKVHPNTVRNWVRAGVLASARLPGTRNHRFDEREVERLQRHRGSDVVSVEPERRAIGPELVNATDLVHWAGTRDAQHRFPELIRRLLASAPGVTNVSVRAGEGVALAGWDGRADSRGTAFLPEGRLWLELGVSARPKAKADADYEDRRQDPKGAEPRAAIFVFMTPRRWAGAADWETARRREGVFADVRVLDADDLEGWLQGTPSVHHWISEELGRHPRGAETLERWWRRFSSQTTPPLPTGLFLAGREQELNEIADLLRGPPEAVAVQARWRDDAIAFVYAAIESVQADRVQPPLIVSAQEAWDRVAEQHGPMTLVPLFDKPDLATARNCGHHVILPFGREQVVREKQIQLPLPHREGAHNALQEAGIETERAYRLSALARRNMPSLVRTLARDPRVGRPPWSHPPASEIIGPLTLIGAWTASDDDLEVVRRLTNAEWDRVERDLKYWLGTDDPPFSLSGKQWHVSSPEEALAVLRDRLTTDDLERWSRAAVDVLSEPDPRLDLPADDRPLANIRGVRRRYSEVLRRGLAESVAVTGSSGHEAVGNGSPGAERATAVVREVLGRANADRFGLLWGSLDDVMPLLAEAAPEVFLDAVHEDLDREAPLLRTLFRDGDQTSWLYSSSPHTGLLWALETLCWSSSYLLSASLALARLAVVDPGGRLANRPLESLKNALVGWVRHTGASLELRVETLEAICEDAPEVGWSLLLELWPETQTVSSPPSSPRFRDWGPDNRGVPIGEWIEYIGHLVRLATRLAGEDAGRWAKLVQHMNALPPLERAGLVEALDRFADPESLRPDDRLVLWEKLHTEITRHRRHADADLSMGDGELSRLEDIATRLEPSARVERFAYLFDWHPELPEVDLSDHERYEQKLLSLRVAAVEEALSGDGLEGVRRLAARSPAPNHLGWTLGMVAYEELNSELFAWLDCTPDELRAVALAWASRKLLDNGAPWLQAALEDPSMNAGPRRLALAVQAPAAREVWTVLQDLDGELSDAYWNQMHPWRIAPADAEYAARRLLEHDRAWAAVDLLASDRHRDGEDSTVTPSLVGEVLEAAIASDPLDGQTQSLPYELGLLLDYLESEGESAATLARYEFLFFQLLEHHRQARALFAMLSADAAQFVALIQLVYRGKSEPKRQLEDRDRALASQAWRVLHHWHALPGRRDDGTVDGDHLTRWVREARLALTESDRVDIGDEEIGRVLSASPTGEDGAWPAEPVRELIETLGSPSIETGLHVGVINARGITSRGVYDGGEQERELASQYRAWAQATASWRRTSRVLRRLAEAYERDARRMDEEAQIAADTE
ncbi:MAG: helix-turn-helix domain-containing protein [Actinomycetota bacterium]|nr:helix-turn-helix domain-containing protein [Actinomycetota bacterium]